MDYRLSRQVSYLKTFRDMVSHVSVLAQYWYWYVSVLTLSRTSMSRHVSCLMTVYTAHLQHQLLLNVRSLRAECFLSCREHELLIVKI